MNKDKRIVFDPSSLPFYEIEEFNGSTAQLDFFNFAVEVAADEIFLMHKDSQVLYVNQSACNHMGYSRDELLGTFAWDWDPNVTKEIWPEIWADISEKKHVHFHSEHRKKSGETFPVEIQAYYYERGGEQFIVIICNMINRLNPQN